MSRTSKDAFYSDHDMQESRRAREGWTGPDAVKQASQYSGVVDYLPPRGGLARHRRPWWMFSFEKWSSVGLFIFFGGAMLGYALSRTPRLSFKEMLKLTTPGEGYWYEQSPWKPNIIIHIITSIPASIFSVFCFLPITYYHWPRLHGFIGYVVSLLLFVSAVTGAVVARRAYGGELNFQSGVYMTASAAAYAVVMGCVEAKRGALDAHREWMIRAWFYNGTFVTARVTALISAQIITAINTYYSLWQCAEIGYVLETPEALAKAFPQCATPNALANPNGLQVSVHASWKEGDLGEASALRATFGMALWVAMMLHFVGIELYLRATADESKKLREWPRRNASVNEQMELPYRTS